MPTPSSFDSLEPSVAVSAAVDVPGRHCKGKD